MRKLLSILIGLLATAVITTNANAALDVTTPSFSDKNAMPVQYTCDGKNISPEINWKNLPSKTESLVLIMSDPDAPNGTFYHWVVYNIPKTVMQFPEGITPTGAITGKNSWNKIQYNGPCPPKGSAHHYVFTLYALDNTLTLADQATGDLVTKTMQGHILEQGQLTTSYGR